MLIKAANISTHPNSELERVGVYQWLTLLSGLLGWLFDSMDLNLFTLVLFPAVAELIKSLDPSRVAQVGGYIVAIKLLCWGIGGIAFGVMADRIGRARTMVITILIYAGFTGLSGLARTWPELATLQALAGFGIGGEWAAGTALVAETWPERHRARIMQVMQMGFALGFFVAALDNLIIGPLSWRWVLVAGAAPAVVALAVRRFVTEPERWIRVRRHKTVAALSWAQTFGSIFASPIRSHTIVGVLVSASMMIGSWGGLTLLPSWIQQLVHNAGLAPAAGVHATSYAFMLMMAGAVAGYLALIVLTDAIGRRASYFIFAVGSLIASLYLFLGIKTLSGVLLIVPIYGFFVIGGFGTFAVYLPELFPTRIRASAQGFCWNFARCVTAVGPLIGGLLVGRLGSFPMAASSTVVFYILGGIAIWFGPETRGQSLAD